MKQIAPEDATERMKTDEDFIILDVREDFEVEASSVPEFVHIPMMEIPSKLDELPKDKEIAVLCHHGSRSAKTAKYLEKHGFSAVNIRGGIEAWAKQTSDPVPRYTKSHNQAKIIS